MELKEKYDRNFISTREIARELNRKLTFINNMRYSRRTFPLKTAREISKAKFYRIYEEMAKFIQDFKLQHNGLDD